MNHAERLARVIRKLREWDAHGAPMPSIPRDEGFRSYVLSECERLKEEYARVKDGPQEAEVFLALIETRDVRDLFLRTKSDEEE